MIFIEFDEGAGLGNQLWHYAALRSLAKKKGTDYSVLSYEKFKGKDFLNIDIGKTAKKKPTKIFYEKLYYDSNFNTLICDFDKDITQIKDNTILKGIYQNEKYFFGNQKKLNTWIKLNESHIEFSKQFKDKIVINIRGGEYKRHKSLLLPKNYWLNAFNIFKKKFSNLEFIVVTDDFHYSKSIFPDLQIIFQDIGKCYAALYGAKALIVSNSSFSYFPIATRTDRPYVVAPLNWGRYKNKKNLWISPGNYYKDWNYLDDKKIINKSNVENLVQNTINYYFNNYKINLISDNNIVKNKFFFLPSSVKKILKKFLKILSPKNF